MGYRPIYHNLLGYQVWFGLYITVDYSDFMQSSPGPVQACNFREANCLPLEIFSDQMCPNALPSTENLFGLMGQVGHLDYEMFVNWSSIEPNARRAAFGLWLTWKQPGILKCWWDQLLHDIFFRIYGKGMMMGFKQMIQGINAIFFFVLWFQIRNEAVERSQSSDVFLHQFISSSFFEVSIAFHVPLGTYFISFL